jgi:hypothetical protein
MYSTNRINVHEDYIEVITRNCDRVLFDLKDEAFVRAHNWHINSGGFASTNININGVKKPVSAHKLLFSLERGVTIRHKGSKLDNRRANFEIIVKTPKVVNIISCANGKCPFNVVEKCTREYTIINEFGTCVGA